MSEPTGHAICVIDVGTARIKRSLWVCGPTGLTRQSQNLIDIEPEAVSVSERVGEAADEAAGQQHLVVITGGHRLRSDGATRRQLLAVASEVGGAFLPLDGDDEGLMLARSYGVEHRTLLVDVGGGSAQFVWRRHDGSLQSRSTPHGTFSIERRFGLTQGSSPKAYDAAFAVVATELGRIPERRRLVVGSNLMGRFFAAFGAWLEFASQEWSPAELQLAYEAARLLDPAKFPDVFPELPAFLYGADKLLGLVNLVAASCAAGVVIGTDASVSHGVAATVAATLPCAVCNPMGTGFHDA